MTKLVNLPSLRKIWRWGMDIFTNILKFLVVLALHWLKAIVGGGGIGFLIGLYERLKHKQVNFKKYITIAILGAFIIASFLAWQDQYITNEKLKSENKDLESKTLKLRAELSRIEIKKETCQKIGELLKEGNTLASACITPKPKPELKIQETNWIKKTRDVLNLINSTYPLRFDQATGITLFHNNVPQINNEVWINVYYKTQVLVKFLEELHC